jgi:hypothetical protein
MPQRVCPDGEWWDLSLTELLAIEHLFHVDLEKDLDQGLWHLKAAVEWRKGHSAAQPGLHQERLAFAAFTQPDSAQPRSGNP